MCGEITTSNSFWIICKARLPQQTVSESSVRRDYDRANSFWIICKARLPQQTASESSVRRDYDKTNSFWIICEARLRQSKQLLNHLRGEITTEQTAPESSMRRDYYRANSFWIICEARLPQRTASESSVRHSRHHQLNFRFCVPWRYFPVVTIRVVCPLMQFVICVQCDSVDFTTGTVHGKGESYNFEILCGTVIKHSSTYKAENTIYFQYIKFYYWMIYE